MGLQDGGQGGSNTNYYIPGSTGTGAPYKPDPPPAIPTSAWQGAPAGNRGGAAAAAGGPQTSGVLSGPGYGEDWYQKYGQDLMKSPSASEQLFAKGMEGSNPYYDYATQVTDKGINDAAAARGGFNSGATIQAIGNANANLRGQQAKGLTDLADQADQGKFSRYVDSSGFANNAQNEEQNRIGQATDAYLRLATGQAGQVDNFYNTAGSELSQANMAAIEAQLKAAGLSTAEAQSFMNLVGGLGGDAIKASA